MSRKVFRFARAGLLIATLERLAAHGTRLPVLRVGGYRLALAPSNRRLYVTRDGAGRIRPRQLGEITSSGIFRYTQNANAKDLESVRAIVENPLDVARGAAILLGLKARCVLCGRLLDSKDRLRGIGEKCYAKAECWRLESKSNKGD